MRDAGSANNPFLFTPAEVARRAGVTTETVRNWEEKGLLRCLRTESGRRLFPRPDVQKFLAARNTSEADRSR